MFRTALLATVLAVVGCQTKASDTDLVTTPSTSDHSPNGWKMGSAANTVNGIAPVPVPKGTSDTSTNSGSYNTGRSTTRTPARDRTLPGNPAP